MSQKELTNARMKANFYRNLIVILTLILLGVGFLFLLLLPFMMGLIIGIVWLLYPHYITWSKGATGEESVSKVLGDLENDYLEEG